MYRTIQDFQQDWIYESEATLKMLKQLTNESLAQKVTDDGRSLGFIAWHTVQSLSEMLGRTGLTIAGPQHDAEMPASAADIAEAYEKAARSVLDEVSSNWQDETLLEEKDMYGERWKNGETLAMLVRHQAHHRGQMTVLMRQAGLTFPGFYGPTREEWTQFGMPVMQ